MIVQKPARLGLHWPLAPSPSPLALVSASGAYVAVSVKRCSRITVILMVLGY
jgi:hypothetical protein